MKCSQSFDVIKIIFWSCDHFVVRFRIEFHVTSGGGVRKDGMEGKWIEFLFDGPATELLLRPIQIGDNGGPIVTSRRSILYEALSLISPVIAFTWAFSPRNLVTLTFTFRLFIYRPPRAPGTLVSEVNETDLSHVNAAWLAARVPSPEN